MRRNCRHPTRANEIKRLFFGTEESREGREWNILDRKHRRSLFDCFSIPSAKGNGIKPKMCHPNKKDIFQQKRKIKISLKLQGILAMSL